MLAAAWTADGKQSDKTIMISRNPLRSACQWLAVGLVVTLTPTFAHAHAGHEHASAFGHAAGITSGIMHPLLGLDHLIAMLAVGLWAAQCGGRALWMVPLSFLTAMVAGGWMGAQGLALPMVETGIATSVLVLGLLITLSARLPLTASVVLVAMFAIFHGHAHGTEMSPEMPGTATGLAYAAGFVIATASLLGLGIIAQRIGNRIAVRKSDLDLIRYAGGVAVAFGLYLFIA
ncbi:HupE/UreJ family protein [Stieleria varia]|uniref:HupE / UreJ protein n=1 Tax=Stieleria varia TaxID=2528005 RepID=A0A5C6B6K8_9BACT|nr:HupE/UreJ family protein [Stieleria varia]TWU07925.1 HupE / UreJ protein [Stieleria varia]